MPLHECPGPDRKKPSVPEEFECPKCGSDIEMWSSDSMVTCPKCKAEIAREELEGR